MVGYELSKTAHHAAIAIGTATLVGYVHQSYKVLTPWRPCPFMTPIRRLVGK